MKKGMIITFEGIDQSGKETQSRMLMERLKDLGYSVGHMYFPDYETAIGKELRAFLDEKKVYSAEVTQLLYAANRYEKINEIKQKLAENDYLIIDRYISSGVAYGVVNGVEASWSINVESKLPQADIVILLDISSEVSRSRKNDTTRDLYEKNYEFLDKVRNTYLDLAATYNWLTVDASKSLHDVHREIWRRFSEQLKKCNLC